MNMNKNKNSTKLRVVQQKKKSKEAKKFRPVEERDFEAIGELRRGTAYARMLVDPANHLYRAPAFGAPRGASRHFTRTFSLYASGADTPFGLMLQPSLKDFLTISSSDISVPITGIHAYGRGAININDHGTKETIGTQPMSVGQNELFYTASGALDNFSITNQDVRVHTYAVYVLQGGWIVVLQNLKIEAGTGTGNLAPSFNPILGNYTGIRIVPDSEHPYNFDFQAWNATSFQRTSMTRSLVKDVWFEAAQVSRWRVSAMSLLATYRGNMLEGAGVIAAARAPKAWVPNGPNLYSALTKLPEDRYKGPLMQGAYSWWLPTDETELDFVSEYTSSGQQTALFVGGLFGDPEGSLEITIDVVVDFYSPLQIFEREYYPVMTDEHLSTVAQLSKLPACTCNPKHLDLLKQGAKTVANGILYGVDLARRNPQLVEAFLKALAGVAAVL